MPSGKQDSGASCCPGSVPQPVKTSNVTAMTRRLGLTGPHWPEAAVLARSHREPSPGGALRSRRNSRTDPTVATSRAGMARLFGGSAPMILSVDYQARRASLGATPRTKGGSGEVGQSTPGDGEWGTAGGAVYRGWE